jgi:hypothetical protein
MLEQLETRAAVHLLFALDPAAETNSDSTLSLAAAIEAYAVNNKTSGEPIADLFRALILAQDLRRTIMDAVPETQQKVRRRFGDLHRRALPSLMAHVRPIGSKKKPFRSWRIDRALNAPSPARNA